MRFSFLALAALTVFIGFSSCSKKSDSTSRKDLITSGRWKLTAETIDPGITVGASTITNLYAQEDFVPSYTKDDVTIFSGAGTYQIEEGTLKKNVTDPAIKETGTWTLSSDEKSMHIQPTGRPTSEATDLTLISVSSSEIKGTFPATITGSTTSYTVSVTFSN
jgi:hypothetical protein